MTKVTPRMQIKEGMTVREVMQNGSAQQRKIACVFDSNRDGKFTGDEVKLFNATSTKENSDGSIDFWTQMSSGKKIKNTVSKDNLKNIVLTMDGIKDMKANFQEVLKSIDNMPDDNLLDKILDKVDKIKFNEMLNTIRKI